jgi:hypothetical protein
MFVAPWKVRYRADSARLEWLPPKPFLSSDAPSLGHSTHVSE